VLHGIDAQESREHYHAYVGGGGESDVANEDEKETE
jgi:hypothetical protein